MLVAFFLFFVSFEVFAAPPTMVNYQGKLTDDSDVEVSDGNYDFKITIWDADSGGNCLYAMQGTCGTPTAKSVTVAGGVFNILVGESSDNALSLDFNTESNYYLEVTVGADSAMTPRKEISGVPYALNALKFNGQDGSYYLDTSATAQIKAGNFTIQGITTLGDATADYLTIYGGNSSGDIRTTTGQSLTITPDAGSGVDVDLSTTGDFVVNTDDFVVDTSEGKVGIGTATPGTVLSVSGLTGTSSYNYARYDPATGDLYYDSSSARYKSNIRPYEEDYTKILGLETKIYTDNASELEEIGLIAEELDALGLVHLVNYRDDGQPDAIKYERIPLYLLEVLKNHDDDLEVQMSILENTHATLETLEDRIATLEDVTQKKTDALGIRYNFLREELQGYYAIRSDEEEQEEVTYEIANEEIEVTYENLDEFQEISLALATGVNTSAVESESLVLRYDVYIENADTIEDYHTELGNRMDEQEHEWDKPQHPYFFDGWNTITLPITQSRTTGEVDYAGINYFRAYFKFREGNVLRIKNVALIGIKKQLPADMLALDFDGDVFDLNNESQLREALVSIAGTAELNKDDIFVNTQEIDNLQDQLDTLKNENEVLIDFYGSLELGSIALLDEDGNLDLFDGKLTAVAVETVELSADTLLADTVQTVILESDGVVAGDITLKNSADAPVVGEAVLPAGETRVVVKTLAVGENSLVYLTPTTSTAGQVPFVTFEDDVDGFVVVTDESVDIDIMLNWWVVSRNERDDKEKE